MGREEGKHSDHMIAMGGGHPVGNAIPEVCRGAPPLATPPTSSPAVPQLLLQLLVLVLQALACILQLLTVLHGLPSLPAPPNTQFQGLVQPLLAQPSKVEAVSILARIHQFWKLG